VTVEVDAESHAATMSLDNRDA